MTTPHKSLFFIMCDLPRMLGKDNEVVSHCVLHSFECRACHLLDGLQVRVREPGISCYLSHSVWDVEETDLCLSCGKMNARLTRNLNLVRWFHFPHRYPLHYTHIYVGIFNAYFGRSLSGERQSVDVQNWILIDNITDTPMRGSKFSHLKIYFQRYCTFLGVNQTVSSHDSD